MNADDFGMTRGINRAIMQGHHEGIITSATLMANSSAFDEAVSLARDTELSVGCHIVLVDGEPLCPTESIPTLLEGARFRRKLWKFAAAAVFGGISPDEVEREASAQIRKLQDAGVAVSHVDCHKHAHMFPAVLEGVIRAAKANGVRAIRNPFEPRFARSASHDFARASETAVLHTLFEDSFREQVHEAGFTSTDGSVGVTATGTLDASTFSAIIRALPPGTFEFVCHPGYNDTDLASAGTRLLESRETELAVLTAKESRAEIARHDIQLISYRKLQAEVESNQQLSHPIP